MCLWTPSSSRAGPLSSAVSVGIVVRRLKKDEDRRAARQWDERERALDRRRPVATPQEILDRRRRRSTRRSSRSASFPSGEPYTERGETDGASAGSTT
jgi:hypothetical protein